MIALLLLAVFVLILLNAFFVAAEFALVRSRKAHLQTDVDEGKKGAATAVNMMDDLSRYSERGAGRHHAHVAGPRLPRRAGDRLDDREPDRRRRPALALDPDLGGPRLPDHDVDPHHARRAGPEDLRDPEGRARRALGRAPAADLHEGLLAVHQRARTRPRTASCGWSASGRRGSSTRASRPRSCGCSSRSPSPAASWTRARRGCSPASSTCTSSRRARS